MTDKNPMSDIVIDKVVVNIGVGQAGERLVRAEKVLEMLTGHKPVTTHAKKTIRDFNIRKGLEIGKKVTLRRKEAEDFINKALFARDRKIQAYSFDRQGNAHFGVPDYTDLEKMKYDPDIGIFGFDVSVVLKRRGGYRIQRRRIQGRHIPKRIRVTPEEAMEFMVSKFNINLIR